MADPLSVIASIAGVVTAGVTISTGLYEIANNLITAPDEVAQMAKELSILASILRNLRTTMTASVDLCKPRLIEDMEELLAKIRAIYNDVKELTRNRGSNLYSLKLLFKSLGPESYWCKSRRLKAR